MMRLWTVVVYTDEGPGKSYRLTIAAETRDEAACVAKAEIDKALMIIRPGTRSFASMVYLKHEAPGVEPATDLKPTELKPTSNGANSANNGNGSNNGANGNSANTPARFRPSTAPLSTET